MLSILAGLVDCGLNITILQLVTTDTMGLHADRYKIMLLTSISAMHLSLQAHNRLTSFACDVASSRVEYLMLAYNSFLSWVA